MRSLFDELIFWSTMAAGLSLFVLIGYSAGERSALCRTESPGSIVVRVNCPR